MKLHKTYLVPAMAILLIGIVIAGYLYFTKQSIEATLVQEVVHADDVSLSFSYPSGDAGYALVEPPTNDLIKKSFILMEAGEYVKVHNGNMGDDAPSTVSILVFSQSEDYTTVEGEDSGRIAKLQNWAAKNDSLTQFSRLENTPDIVELDGVKALHYTASGAYEQDIYLASYRDKIYMFTGQYEDSDDDIHKMFETLMKTVVFE